MQAGTDVRSGSRFGALLGVLALLAGTTGAAFGQGPGSPGPADSVEVEGWKVGVMNTADLHGDILPCT